VCSRTVAPIRVDARPVFPGLFSVSVAGQTFFKVPVLKFFSCKGSQIVCLDEKTSKILNEKAIASRQTPSEIIASMLRKKLTVAHAN
jgi:hypothetical protein